MPAFDTPDPISATIDVAVGNVRLTAGESGTTHVDVQPNDPSNGDDVKAATQTRVELQDGRLLVKGPRGRWVGRVDGGSIDVAVELPAGSEVSGTGGVADYHCDGRLGDCRIKTGLGHIGVDSAGTVNLRSGSGDVSVDRATGHTDIKLGSGDVRVRELDGTAVVKNSNGDTWIGVAGGELRVSSANGSITVDVARAGVGAKTARGDIRLGDVERGAVVLETSLGDLQVGIPEGTAAWLDVSATAGQVQNALDESDAPGPGAETVEVRARTSFGDVVIGRPVAGARAGEGSR